MNVRSETNFCCLCLNTEVKFWKMTKKTATILKEFLDSQFLDVSLYKNICMMCYTLLMKSIKFKEQCLEARYLYFKMVHVSQESLNILYKLNFKPNLSQTRVNFLNIDALPSLSERTDPVIPTIEELNVDYKEEIVENESVLDEDFKPNLTQTKVNFLNVDVFPSLFECTDPVIPTIENLNVNVKKEIVGNESVLDEDFKPNLRQTQITFIKEEIVEKEFVVDEKLHFIQENGLKIKDNLFRGLNVVENDKVVIEMDKRTPETLMCLTDKELDEKKYVKEECSNSNQEENLNIADVDSDDDTPLNKMLKTEDTGEILEKIDISVPARKCTIIEVPQKADRVKPDEMTKDRKPLPNAVLKILPKDVKISKSKKITKSAINVHKVTEVSPKDNNKFQAKNAIVQNNETFNCELSYNNASNEMSVDAVAPSTSLDRIDEGNKSNIYNRKGSENDLNVHLGVQTKEKPFLCDLCDYRCARKDYLIIHIKRKHTMEKNYSCNICEYRCIAKRLLNVHLRKHTGEKPYTCDLCDHRFASKEYLTKHVKYKHTKEKKFSCHICQYKCVAKRTLNIHLYTHTKERNFLCRICHNKFVAKGNPHLQVHTRKRLYICDTCNQRFNKTYTKPINTNE